MCRNQNVVKILLGFLANKKQFTAPSQPHKHTKTLSNYLAMLKRFHTLIRRVAFPILTSHVEIHEFTQ